MQNCDELLFSRALKQESILDLKKQGNFLTLLKYNLKDGVIAAITLNIHSYDVPYKNSGIYFDARSIHLIDRELRMDTKAPIKRFRFHYDLGLGIRCTIYPYETTNLRVSLLRKFSN